MEKGKFTSQDNCEYIYRESHYRKGSSMRHVRRKLAQLKVYIIVLFISAGGGAAAVYLPELMAKQTETDSGNMMDMLQKMQNMQGNPQMMQQMQGMQKP